MTTDAPLQPSARRSGKENAKFRETFSKSNLKAIVANAKLKAAVVAHTVASEIGLKSKKD